ncbi:HIT family protein [Aurantimonas sp. C2-6-R+9]|uniref:HIT family protein n=1 Tax=unclassified Aurantimonas TaxID=2638230 RepID=UPI002E18F34E|nr:MULTISPECIES: HIT family protein [unclassified Aurantimonas]MEC5290453.1 HIT family protein [Aurantimonas sp. C2-3-R2]MEC5380539.1 HIT family protein [Aurantimonas sp. C2-6-R+9]MEC5411621.1 HIT family protein [Aurantimonas sp. C2-4-R8]
MDTYDDGNIFAKILRGELPSQTLYENAAAIAIMDVMPESKGHCLVIPKAPSRNLLDATDETLAKVMPVVAKLARAVKKAFEADGVRIAQFNETPAGQTVFHLHFHVVPIYDGVPLKRHAGGMLDQAVLSEQADRIRAALG